MSKILVYSSAGVVVAAAAAYALYQSSIPAGPARHDEAVAVARAQERPPGEGMPSASPDRDVANQPVPARASNPSSENAWRHVANTDQVMAVAHNYVDLANAAKRGDLEAARTLAKTLHDCVDAPRSTTEVENRLQELRSQDDVADAESDARHRRAMTAEMQRCIALPPERLAEHGTWIGVAADLGDSNARLLYPQAARPTDRRDGRFGAEYRDYAARVDRYLQAEISAGNVNALVAASSAYAFGNGYRADPAMAYAYEYAYALASGAQSPVIATVLEQMRSRVPGGRLEEATALGEQIYSKCCSGGS